MMLSGPHDAHFSLENVVEIWTGLSWLRIGQVVAPVNAAMNLWVP
jgi:hypothetical protein